MIDELDPRSRALLDEEAGLDEPTDEELASTRAAVFARLGMPLPPTTAPSEPEATPPPPVVPAATTGAGAKALAALAVVATLATVAYLARPASAPAPAPHITRAPTPTVVIPAPVVAPAVEQPATEAPAIDEPRAIPTRPVETRPRVEEPAPEANVVATPEPTPEDLLAEQSMLVAAAEAQLRAGHASEALSLFDRSLARHPTGTLRAESLAGRIAALCRLGRTDEGRSELTRFLASYPRSPSAPRLRSTCGVEE